MIGSRISANVSCIEMKKISTSKEEVADGIFNLDDAIGHQLRRAYQRTSAVLISQIGEYDITPVQFATLARLYELQLVSQNKLGRLVDVEPSNFHGVINRLLKRKLIRKQKDSLDQRKINLSLSNSGLELIELLIPKSQRATETTLAVLNQSQQRQLYKLLGRILGDTP
jgi:MarR family transcriptional regulator, lower aerobic nicotinate degradation pathway regulator